MKPFRFTLQAVFTLREQKEHAAQQHYMQMMSALENINTRLQDLQHEIDLVREHLRRAFKQGASASQLASIEGYSVVLGEREKEIIEELAAARLRVHTAWQAILKATQDREAMTKLSQRQRRGYDYALGRDEQKLLDDLAARSTSLSETWQAPHDFEPAV